MNKSKSIYVTALMALMLAAILVGLYMLHNRAYTILAGLLGVYGFLCGAANFCRWLGRDTPLLPAPEPKKPRHQEPDEFWPPDPEWTGRYDDIKAEVEAEHGAEDI